MDMRWPENDHHRFPVEIAFTIAGQFFALEHTGIEPFKGHVQMDAEAGRLFKPIVEALKGALGTALGWDEGTVGEYEGGRPPDARRLAQLRAVLGKPPS